MPGGWPSITTLPTLQSTRMVVIGIFMCKVWNISTRVECIAYINKHGLVSIRVVVFRSNGMRTTKSKMFLGFHSSVFMKCDPLHGCISTWYSACTIPPPDTSECKRCLCISMQGDGHKGVGLFPPLPPLYLRSPALLTTLTAGLADKQHPPDPLLPLVVTINSL